ncbi:NACHT domain- and WD repeat-containing protein 1-like isoform X2 [Dreissena polymorpha]|nr:NACHT domain- and WD repeat-containing protein 1-like isoform X2 [Dreissena polymorpha]
MRWGVLDEATDEQLGTELCLKELGLCQQLSTEPSFLSLLSHKFGYIAFPRVIAVDEFEPLMTQVEEPETVRLFHKKYGWNSPKPLSFFSIPSLAITLGR